MNIGLYFGSFNPIHIGHLVIANHILNETEINYKSAKNKRLHVELALIRLTYLLQAIELSSAPDGLAKKKLVDVAKPVAFKNIPAIRPVSKPTEKKFEPKLVIEKPVHKEPAQPAISIQEETEVNIPPSEPEKSSTSVKSAQLEKLRKQIAERAGSAENAKTIALQQHKLQEAWNEYTSLLRENKNPAAQSFELAQLRIISDSSFEVITNNNLEHKFIEQEKRILSEHLQNTFANKLLNFTVTITDNPVELTPREKTLSKKDQFLMMTEQYPMIKELKDKLKLDLDY